MHHRYFVLTNKSNAKTSEEARDYVNDWLDRENFANEGTRYSSSFCDWYVIGGRWSGELTTGLLNKDKMKLFWEEFERQQLSWTNNSDKKEETQKEKAHKLFMLYFPKFKGDIPIYRDNYNHRGFEDDAKIVTKKIWDCLLKDFEDTDCFDGNESITDTDDDTITKEGTIGKKWIVVVDYHT